MKKETNIVINDFHLPRWDELPNVALYLDQVVNLINSYLSPYIFFNCENQNGEVENQFLTKTMINNYVKNSLIDTPVKKQYSKLQLAKLFVICVLKQVYSMQDIKELINIALSNSEPKTAYDSFCRLFEEALSCTYSKKDFIDTYSKTDDLYLLKSVLLSCSYKMYVKNVLAVRKSN